MATPIMEKCRKCCSLIGVHFALAPLSFVWIYGNLSAYMNSYFHFQCNPGCLDADSQWILGLYVAGQFPGMLLMKPLVQVFGLRWTGIGAMIINNGAVLASAWVLQHSVAWTAAIYGVLMGPCVGLSHGVLFQFIYDWAPEWTAILVATVTSFPTFLSIVQNQVITAYVNPDNLKVDAEINKQTYFSQPELLNRLPGAVIIIAALNFGLQLIGYCLISNPPTPNVDLNTDVKTCLSSTDDDQSEQSKVIKVAQKYGGFEVNRKFYEATTTHIYQPEAESKIEKQSRTNIYHNAASENLVSNSNKVLDIKNYNDKTKPVSWKPLEMLQSPAYYAILFFGIALEFGILLKSNFYKEFGQRYIHNDWFLTLVGTLIPVTSIISRIVLGALINKGYFSLKDVVVFGLSCNGVLCLFWYFVPQVDAILYLFLVLGLAMAQCLFWVVVPTSALKLFGPDHLTVNFALVQACVFVSSFIMPIIVPPIIRGLGWFWLFALCGIFSLAVLVYALCVSFDTQSMTKTLTFKEQNYFRLKN